MFLSFQNRGAAACIFLMQAAAPLFWKQVILVLLTVSQHEGGFRH